MMRVITAAVLVALGGAVFGPMASAQSAPQDRRIAQQWNSGATDASAQRQNRRPPTRLRVQPYYESSFDGVYPRYYPGRNAVRECTAHYVQEYRPSGTVIVPRMNCFWRPG
jgi:Ni/Co efflux regulator RcnB